MKKMQLKKQQRLQHSFHLRQRAVAQMNQLRKERSSGSTMGILPNRTIGARYETNLYIKPVYTWIADYMILDTQDVRRLRRNHDCHELDNIVVTRSGRHSTHILPL
jgi:hypothetical protein